MLEFPDHAREMRRGEEDAVDALLRAAFETGAEANLLHNLRNPVKSQAKQSYQWGTVSWATMPCPEWSLQKSGCALRLLRLPPMFRDAAMAHG